MAVLNLGVLLSLALSLSESAASVSAPVWVGDGSELLDWSPWCLVILAVAEKRDEGVAQLHGLWNRAA